MRAECADEVSKRSNFLMKRSSYKYYSFAMRSLFTSLYNFESCLFQLSYLRYFYIAVVVFHLNEKIFKAYDLLIKISLYTSFHERNIFSICKSTLEYVALNLSSNQFIF
jgi:hypothetical protein